MSERILLVDDDAGVRDVVAFPLRREGFEVEEQRDGPGALEAGRTGGYDLVILDVMLPGLSGTEVCRALRAESDVPILMLTAREVQPRQLRSPRRRLEPPAPLHDASPNPRLGRPSSGPDDVASAPTSSQCEQSLRHAL